MINVKFVKSIVWLIIILTIFASGISINIEYFYSSTTHNRHFFQFKNKVYAETLLDSKYEVMVNSPGDDNYTRYSYIHEMFLVDRDLNIYSVDMGPLYSQPWISTTSGVGRMHLFKEFDVSILPSTGRYRIEYTVESHTDVGPEYYRLNITFDYNKSTKTFSNIICTNPDGGELPYYSLKDNVDTSAGIANHVLFCYYNDYIYYRQRFTAYSVSLYTFNQAPFINIVTPSSNETFSAVAGHNTIALSGTVRDTDIGDILKVYYRIDGSAGQAGTQVGSNITANGANQAYSGNINVDSQSEGTHNLYVWVEDDKGGKSPETAIQFNIDKTGPAVSFVPAVNTKVASTENIAVTINASDLPAGVKEIRYTIPNESEATPIKVECSTVVVGTSVDVVIDDGRKYVYAYAIDNVGNESNVVKSPLYVINTKPGVVVTSPEDDSWHKN